MLHRAKTAALSISIAAATIVLSSQYVFAGIAAVSLSLAGSNSDSASSWLGGVQVGHNWQRGSLVYGVEADISAINLNSEMNTALQDAINPDATANAHARVNWYGSLRGRLGWAAGPWLFYGTGGFAYGKVNLSSSFNAAITGAVPGSLNAQTSPLRGGWVAGFGLEYLLNPNLTLGFGYQYIDLGTVNVASSTLFPSGFGTVQMEQSARVHAAFHVVAASLNWHFSPTNARPWEGSYAGGHVGGAWGNNASADYSYACDNCVFFSDARLKRDIVLVGHLKDGLRLYRYRYLWSDTVYVGVLAQEVALDHPDAVVKGADGYLRVNYSKLGLKLLTQAEWDAVRARQRLALCCSQ